MNLTHTFQSFAHFVARLHGHSVRAHWLGIVLFIIAAQRLSAQVLLSGTSFDPSPGYETKTYFDINGITQYGLQPGAITPGTNLTPNANANVFNGSYYYAITNNPLNLDNVRYNNITAQPDYQMVFSPTTATSNMLTYKLTGVTPGTQVSVKVDYCSVVSPTYTSCGPGEFTSLKGVVNPDAYSGLIGIESPQIKMGACSTFTFSTTTSNSNPVGTGGDVVVNINTQYTGACKAISITKIEILGTPQIQVMVAEGSEVCAGEQITLQTKQAYNGTCQWQVNSGTGWINISGATNPSQLYEVDLVKTYQFRLLLTPLGGGSVITSNPVSVNAITCCTENAVPTSRQTIYYDNFGRVDMTDLTGKHYIIWDYTDPLHPKEVTKATSTPFRWALTPAPLGATFQATGPPLDGQYTVAGVLTGYNPYTGQNGMYQGAMLQWAGNVTGQLTQPTPVTLDHSGAVDGGALFLNCPPNTVNQAFYSRTISNLCAGKQIFFECWIAVFTNSASGAYNPVNVKVKLTDSGDPTNVATVTGTATRAADGGGVWVKIATQINLKGTALQFDLINNEDLSVNGNDLVVDDIKIMTCSAPQLPLYFGNPLSKTDSICTKSLVLRAMTSNLLKNYFGNSPQYLFQYSQTPDNDLSWKNINSPQTADSILISNPKSSLVNLKSGDPLYFRTIAASSVIFVSHNNFQSGNTANLFDPCRNYSISTPILATMSSDPTCSIVTSLLPDNEDVVMQFHPNPTKDVLLLAKGAVSTQVYNMTGTMVLQSNSEELHLASLPVGIYQVVATLSDGRIVSQRVLKE